MDCVLQNILHGFFPSLLNIAHHFLLVLVLLMAVNSFILIKSFSSLGWWRKIIILCKL